MFHDEHGDFTNYGREGKAIKSLIKFAADDEVKLLAIVQKFLTLTKSNDKFWGKQPFVPSALVPLWERVIEEIRPQEHGADWIARIDEGETL